MNADRLDFKLRLPAWMKGELEAEAERQSRSLNAQIIHMLNEMIRTQRPSQ